eukprot:TRINITY_DN2027_c0_g1_i1.p1 TRINITY_DN2027_c0_g1~~TRINITY_DN2027_c0_g1_i1.p1  ORF type:complete len:158 (-),score=34.66 TRINITY_DN2027_c0_g1_i1:110-583(-)
MRLNSAGYVFSCSLPPYCSSASQKAFELLSNNSKELHTLQQNIALFYKEWRNANMNNFVITGDEASPVVHLRLRNYTGDTQQQETKLLAIINQIRERNQIVLCKSRYAKDEKFTPEPTIKILITAEHVQEDISQLIAALKEASNAVEKSEVNDTVDN